MTSDNSTFKNIRKLIGYLMPFLLMGIFLYLAFKNVDLMNVFGLISQSSLFWLIIYCVIFILSHFARAVRWKIMISSVKEDTSLLNLFGATMIGYGVNCVIPRLGELYRASFLGRWENISRTSMLGTIILERVIDTLALGLAVLISVLIYSGNLYNEVEWLRVTVYLVFLIIAVITVILFLIVKLKERFYKTILKFFGKISVRAADKVAYIFEMLAEGFSSIRSAKSYFYTILLTCIIMLLYGATAFLAFYVLRINDFSEISYGMAWVIMSVSAFGIVIPTPGGTGSYHYIVISVLTGLYGLSDEMSSAYAILTHSISYIIFISSLLFFIVLINKLRVRSGLAEVNFLSAFKIKPDER